MSKALRNLRFLQRRHRVTGFDVDYLLKLDAEQLAWLETFARKYYNGEGESDPERKKEANHRRYMSKSADAMGVSNSFTEGYELSNADHLTPERILLLQDLPTPTRRLRSKKGRSNEIVEEKT